MLRLLFNIVHMEDKSNIYMTDGGSVALKLFTGDKNSFIVSIFS